MKKQAIYLFFLLAGSSAFAQDAAAAQPAGQDLFTKIFSDPMLLVLFLLAFVLLICVLMLLGISLQMGLYHYQKLKKEGSSIPVIIRVFGLIEGDNTALTGVYRDEVLEDHDYDGIKEYDNDLPPWWVYMFYLTFAFAVAYISVYHVFKVKPLMYGEYQEEVEAAEKLYANVDLEYDAPSTDEAVLSESKSLFVQNCAACHGQLGEGGVGPNLTDKAWLHGGNVNKIYNTIKYGFEEKGMKSWKNEFSNQQIYGLSSYILSIQGTNPPNAKEAQGEVE